MFAWSLKSILAIFRASLLPRSQKKEDGSHGVFGSPYNRHFRRPFLQVHVVCGVRGYKYGGVQRITSHSNGVVVLIMVRGGEGDFW